MKNTLLWLAVIVVSMAACKEVEKLTEFNMTYNSAVTVPKSTLLDLPVTIYTPDVETNSSAEFEVHDTRKDLIEEIILTGITLDITAPSEQTFSFLESIHLYIAAEGLEEIEIAKQADIDDNIGKTLSLEPTRKDLKEYIKKDKFTLRVETVTDEALSKDVDIAIASNFFVNAKVLGF